MNESKTKPYENPFHFHADAGVIFDKNEMWALTVRGYGSLTGHPHELSEDEACDAQDKFGCFVVRALSCHEALLKALKECVKIMKDTRTTYKLDIIGEANAAVVAAELTINKAKKAEVDAS